MKKNLFSAFLVMALVLSMGTALYAASGTYRYPNGYTMTYSLGKLKVNGKNGAYAATSTKSNVEAHVKMLVYDSSGQVIANKTATVLKEASVEHGDERVKNCKSTHYLIGSGLGTQQTLSVTY